MALTEITYTGTGGVTFGPIPFPYLEESDVLITINGAATSAFTIDNSTKIITFSSAPAIGSTIRVYRNTDNETLAATFVSGSAIRAVDLNDNFTQNLYVIQELDNNSVQTDGSTPFVGDVDMGGYKITNLAHPVADNDAANRSFVEQSLSSEFPIFYRRWSKTAVGGETSLSGNDDNGISLSYVAGSEKVFINGVLQVRGVDYTGTNGTTLTGISALTVDDIVEVHSSSNYTVATVPDGSVTDAKVDGGAAIQSTKLAFTLGATTRTVESKLRDVVSVKDFGAVGDGVTDDTDAIQNAINVLRGSGTALYFPAGRYKITNTLFCPFNYNGTSYPENQVVMFHMFGDGKHATRIEWHGTVPMTDRKKAMMILEGFCSLSDMQFICPRLYRGFNPEFSSIRTPYYGIVMKNTAWRATLKDVVIKYVHVPFSAGVARTWRNGGSGDERYEIEPLSGGSTLSADYAQNTYINCTFEARTDEFFDGTFDPNTTLNNRGTNLSRGSAETVDLSTISYSDGSFALEIAKPQSVVNEFYGCQIIQNNPNSIGAIRVHDNSQTSFDGCMIVSGYGRIGIFCYCPTFTGPAVFTTRCYFIGNIAGWSSTQGLLTVKDCDGEWVRPGGSTDPNDDLYILCGHNYGTTGFGTRLVMDEMVGVRGSGYNRVFLLRSGGRGTTAVGGSVESYIVRNRMKPMWWQGRIDIAGISHTNVPASTTSLANDLPSVLRNSAGQPESLPASAYTCRSAATRGGWSTRIVRGGRWFFSADIGSTNFIAPAIAIDGQTGAYNISVDIWLKLKSGKTTADLTTNNVKCEVYWLSASDINTVVNGGVAAPVLFNGTSFGQLTNDSVTTRVANMVIPPTDAGWLELRITSTGTNASVVEEIGVGNFKVWDALCADCTSLVTSY